MTLVEVYGRQGCHLCDDAIAQIEAVRAEIPFRLVEVDVDSDPLLAAQYGHEVPVVLVDGRRHAKFHLDAAAFRRRLRGSAGQ